MMKKVEKEWGSEDWIVNREYCGKILNLKKGFSCSLHYHKIKDETFFVLEGQVLFELDGETKILQPGDTIVLPSGQRHRFTGLEDSRIIEFSTHHEEEDSYREIPSGKLNFNEIFDNFENVKVVVIGDIMLDIFIEGSVSRTSQEAPVPVVEISNKYFSLGGAANVASNIRSLGGKACVFGFVGNDAEAAIIKNLLEQKGIEYYLANSQMTSTKTRVIGNGQQIVRYDKENKNRKIFDSETALTLIEKCGKANVIVISDYAKGAITEELMKILNTFKSKIIVDPKSKNKLLYKDVFLIKPNEKELFEMTGNENVEQAGMLLMKELNSHLLVTRGAKGMVLFKDRITEIPTYGKEVYDVSGSGDTVSASLALSIAAGASLESATIISNYAAGIGVSRKGVYSVGLDELKEVISQNESKVVSLERLKKFVEDNRRKNKKIVWTNGCFDILHIGHVKYLKEAKKMGDILIVGLNSDESIRKLKGDDRPIQSELERAEILASLNFIDQVIIFSELDCSNYLNEIKPDVYVKGNDYNLETISQPERKIVENYRGSIKFVPIVKGRSTTNIINKLKSSTEDVGW